MKINIRMGHDGKPSRNDVVSWRQSVRACKTGGAYVYLNKPKCACSTTKRALWQTEYDLGRIADPPGRHVSNVDVGPFSREIELVGGFPEDAFVFTFVRNPYTRILSCYRDKVMKGVGVEGVKVLWELEKHLAVGKRKVSFIEFLRFVASQRNIDRNPHWRTMKALHMPRVIRCDFVGSVENYAVDMEHVYSRIYPGIAPNLQNLNSQRHKYPDAISDEEAELIRKIYKGDFEFFGYSDLLSDMQLPPRKV